MSLVYLNIEEYQEPSSVAKLEETEDLNKKFSFGSMPLIPFILAPEALQLYGGRISTANVY